MLNFAFVLDKLKEIMHKVAMTTKQNLNHHEWKIKRGQVLTRFYTVQLSFASLN